MRQDGTVTYFFIEHLEKWDTPPGRWTISSLEHFLFHEMSYIDNRGDLGDRYRALLAPQSASTPLWQKYGINGFIEQNDAEAVLEALRHEHPDREFRLVFRTIMQQTAVVAA